MALLNPRFADAGVLAGEAANWLLTAHTSLEAIAAFGSQPPEAVEAFERWAPRWSELTDVTVVLAFFEGDGRERFEAGWGNSVFLTELPPALTVDAPFGGGTVDNVERGWRNDVFARSWGDVAAVVGAFGGEPLEAFERRWRSNEGFARDWSVVTAAAARFDGAALTTERFEGAWTAIATL